MHPMYVVLPWTNFDNLVMKTKSHQYCWLKVESNYCMDIFKFITCNCFFLKVDTLNLPKFLLVIGLIIIGCIMIAKVYQEPKKNGSQAASWKKLTGDTIPGLSKLQFAMHLLIKQLIFDVICWIILDLWRGWKALEAGVEVVCHQKHTSLAFFFFLFFFCSCQCYASVLPHSLFFHWNL